MNALTPRDVTHALSILGDADSDTVARALHAPPHRVRSTLRALQEAGRVERVADDPDALPRWRLLVEDAPEAPADGTPVVLDGTPSVPPVAPPPAPELLVVPPRWSPKRATADAITAFLRDNPDAGFTEIARALTLSDPPIHKALVGLVGRGVIVWRTVRGIRGRRYRLAGAPVTDLSPVAQRRPAPDAPPRGYRRDTLPPRIVAQLGQMPDVELAALAGVDRKTIAGARRLRGIEPATVYAPTLRRRREVLDLLSASGPKTCRELAEALGWATRCTTRIVADMHTDGLVVLGAPRGQAWTWAVAS